MSYAKSSSVSIREFGQGDFDTLCTWFPNEAALVQWGGSDTRFPPDYEQLRGLLSEGEGEQPRRWLLSGIQGATVIGHAQVALDWRQGVATLSRIATGPDYQGRRLSEPFLRLVLNRVFASAGFERIELNVYTFNAAAIRVYCRLSFTKESIRRAAVKVGLERWDTTIFWPASSRNLTAALDRIRNVFGSRSRAMDANGSIMIRPGEEHDAESLFDIHVDAVKSQCATAYSKEQIRRWFEGRPATEYVDHLSRGRIWVATSGERLLGFTECWPGNIDRLFVSSLAAGRGVGGILLEFAIEQAFSEGHEVIQIEATLNAHSFYEKHGFRKTLDSSFTQPSGIEIETILMELAAPA